MKNHPDIKISPLFEGGKSYVHSVTTLATPHNGTTLADGSLRYRSLKIYSLQEALEETIIYHYMILNWINGV